MQGRPHPVRHHLLDRGIKLVDLARAIDVEYEPLRRSFNGEVAVRQDVAERAAAYLGFPVSALFRLDEVRPVEAVAA